jgi:uncharacterized protein (TIGR03000 family)
VIVVPGHASLGYTVPATTAVASASQVSPNTAKVVVTLPADAKLTFDGHQNTTSSDRREFVSPTLTPDMDYHYTVKAEVIRDGKPVVKTESVTVRAGKTSTLEFKFAEAVAAK